MAKRSVRAREAKRAPLIAKFLQHRRQLKQSMVNSALSEGERFQAALKLQKLPRNSSRVRQRNRCALTGRSGGFLRKFGLCRIKVREVALRGEIPGLRMASW